MCNADSKCLKDASTKLFTDLMLWQLVPTGVGMKSGRDQEMKLLKASLSTGLYLYLTVDNLSTVITQKRRTFYMPIKGLQEVVVGVIMAMKEPVEISNSR